MREILGSTFILIMMSLIYWFIYDDLVWNAPLIDYPRLYWKFWVERVFFTIFTGLLDWWRGSKKESESEKHKRRMRAKKIVDDYWKSYAQNHRYLWNHPVDRDQIEYIANHTTYSDSIIATEGLTLKEKVKRLETKDPEQLDIVVDCPYFYATERITFIKPDCPETFRESIDDMHNQTLEIEPSRRKIVMQDLAEALVASDTTLIERWAIGDDGELVRK